LTFQSLVMFKIIIIELTIKQRARATYQNTTLTKFTNRLFLYIYALPTISCDYSITWQHASWTDYSDALLNTWISELTVERSRSCFRDCSVIHFQRRWAFILLYIADITLIRTLSLRTLVGELLYSDSYRRSTCLSVVLSVCLSVCLSAVFFKMLLLRQFVSVMLSPRGQNFGLGLKHLTSAWPRSRCLIM